MDKARILYVFQEITPYVPESEISIISRNLPQGIQERGREIRTFLPKYGCINERRNQLHEVIRLSGMNLIINETDHPLIIKVASIQAARMQIYFIDNEDYFGRKHMFSDEKGVEFSDNDERTIFFTRGVLETINKLSWSPDIIHCHGWFTGLIALYTKKAYSDNPLFANTRIITSIYADDFSHNLNKKFKDKVIIDGISKRDVEVITAPSYVNLSKLIISQSDGVIFTSPNVNQDLRDHAKKARKTVLEHNAESYIDDYHEFYDKIANQ